MIQEIIDFLNTYIKAHGCTEMNKWVEFLEQLGWHPGSELPPEEGEYIVKKEWAPARADLSYSKFENGKEIYEGDILLYNGNRRIVEWKYGTFGLSIHENGFPFQAFYELPVPIVDSTVIGNIHDNPELIKKGGEQ